MQDQKPTPRRVLVPAPKSKTDRPVGEARVTVVQHVYHYRPGKQAVSKSHRFCRTLKSGDEQAYSRELTVAEEWTQLDLGWVKEASVLVLSNEEKSGEPVELALLPPNYGKSEEFASDYPLIIIRPKESQRLELSRIDSVVVRLRGYTGASAKISIFAVPA